MNSYIFLVFLIGVSAAVTTYTTKYDNIDLDEILNNERLYKKYFECLSNKGKCTPDGKELKDIIPEALATECKKCSEKHKKGAEKILKFMIEKKAEDYAVLEKIYDPQGQYKKKFMEQVKNKGIKMVV
ncbi:ejaculatory bulb-specific protein 3 [Halyomorpha halys]|uniref:ejaculatory bulb-specific protein 3 n=1 Tax=Halyomorpha halys TaxID=286706 RepID=UPI0006D4F4FC|nr:ejaculatory bulb-specific protein 3-like [Halyomorpha halys]